MVTWVISSIHLHDLCLHSLKVSLMDPLHKKVIFRTLGFLLLWSLSSCVFVLIEHTDEDNVEVKRKMLWSAFEAMALKYNMSIQDFNYFSNVAYEALSEPKMQWTFITAMRFVFQAVTTIGKRAISTTVSLVYFYEKTVVWEPMCPVQTKIENCTTFEVLRCLPAQVNCAHSRMMIILNTCLVPMFPSTLISSIVLMRVQDYHVNLQMK